LLSSECASTSCKKKPLLLHSKVVPQQFWEVADMFLRASKTIVAIPHEQNIICHDYMTKVSVECEAETLYWLSCFDKWSKPEDIVKKHLDYDSDSLLKQFSDLAQIGLLQKQGSEHARRQEQYFKEWKFGFPSAMLHLSCSNSEFMSMEQATTEQIERLARSPSPPLFTKDCPIEGSIGFQKKSKISELLRLMATRRTNRSSEPKEICRHSLLDCLFAGLGITAFTTTVAGELPLKMTPSGGARNPFEAYVLVKNIAGMHPGFYHFSASDCRLSPIASSLEGLSSSQLLGGQAWADDMPAIVFLVAMFERTMWKYRDDNAYRVILIEAGHIAQNIILAATAHGLTGCPTAALAHDEIADRLGLTSDMHNPLYAITLSYSRPSDDPYYPNEDLPKPLRDSLVIHPTTNLH
jgi:SagB-type dehydrogenase family enzyme